MKPHDDRIDNQNENENQQGDSEMGVTNAARLTAYALGEMDGSDCASERAEIEALIATDDAARAVVEEVRATAELLTTGFASESPELLEPVVRAEVVLVASAASATDEAPAPAGRMRSLWPLVGVAASIAGVVSLGMHAESGPGASPRGGAPEWARATPGEHPDLSAQRDARERGRDAEISAASAAEVAKAGAEGKRLVLRRSNQALAERSRKLEDSRRQLDGRKSKTRRFAEGADKFSATASGGKMEVIAAHGAAAAVPVPGGSSAQGPRSKGDSSGVYVFGAGGGAGGGHLSVGAIDGADGGRASPGPGAGSGVRRVVDGRTREAGGRGGAVDGASAPVREFVGPVGGGYRGPQGEVPPSKPGADTGAEPAWSFGAPIVTRTAIGVRDIESDRSTLLVAGKPIDTIELTAETLDRIRVDLKNANPQHVVRFFSRVDQTWRGFQRQGNAELAARYKLVAEQAASVLIELEGRDGEFERGQRLRDRLGLRYGVPGTEEYTHPGESTFNDPADDPLSTFAVDVDTASYANMRRFLSNGQMPPVASVRVEEMVNYFSYKDAAPSGEHPIAASIETASCPWNTDNRLVRIGIKAKTITGPRPASNLVFLIDVSGSMRPADKLPLLQRAMGMLVDQMDEGDRVAIITYASDASVGLQSTDGANKDAIKAAINGLVARGSTNGGAGIQDAYAMAQKHFIKGGVNRVILASDGDFNAGVTDRDALTKIIAEKAKTGVFLSILGVGTGNLKDATLEALADRGNGNYHYLDGVREGRKVLVEDLMGTVVTVAKDVKLQIEFNPVKVGAYRLIGYENRALAAADFNDDTKDAGEMGAGHTVTALYEIVPNGGSLTKGVDPLRYQRAPVREATDDAHSDELLTLKVRYKQPDGETSVAFELSAKDSDAAFDTASEDLRWSSAVATFGMLLRGSPAAAGSSFDAVLELAGSAIGEDKGGRRSEFLDLVLKAKKLTGR